VSPIRIAPRITTVCSSLALALALEASPAMAQGRAAVDERSAIRRLCRSPLAEELRSAGNARVVAAEALGSVYDNPRLRLEHQRVLEGPEDNETIVGLGFPSAAGAAYCAMPHANGGGRRALK
jgi:hypothetical protein